MSHGLDAKAAEEQIVAIWTPDDGEPSVIGRRAANLGDGGGVWKRGELATGCTLQVSIP